VLGIYGVSYLLWYGFIPKHKMISGFDGKCLQQRFVLLKNLKTSENGWRKGEK
jgi:hypothetical protein